jgi:DNA polymerase elongation subunit (family B)
MLRAYLQESKAIPTACDREDYEGAISFGNPGVYKNVFKLDVASLYPSLMLQYNIYNPKKDPERKFLGIVEYLTKQRLENKRLHAETGKRYFKDMSEGQKIVINSCYGFLGTGGLNFNYPEGAALVTGHGRKLLKQALAWAESKGYKITNADTDSISYEAPFAASIATDLAELNGQMPERIRWENDGVFDSMVIVKAKNYAMKQGGKIKIKGSGLKATMKEIALAEFLEGALQLLLSGNQQELPALYLSYVQEILTMPNIGRWTSKKTVTESVLNPQRKNEQSVLDAIGDKIVQEGDKLRVFFVPGGSLCLEENFSGVYCQDRLLDKLYATVKILAPVLDMSQFVNYKLKKNKKLLGELCQNKGTLETISVLAPKSVNLAESGLTA